MIDPSKVNFNPEKNSAEKNPLHLMANSDDIDKLKNLSKLKNCHEEILIEISE